MPRQIINEILQHPPASGHRISFVRLDGRSTLDLTELYDRSGRLAVALAKAGLKAGDRIGVLAGNGPDWVLLDLAALRLKVVVAGLEPGKFTAGRELIERYELALLFTDRPVADDDPRIRPMAEVAALCTQGESAPPVLRYQPEEACAIKFTSGSSGEPKGLAASVGSIDSSITAIQQLFEHGPEDDLFLFLPLSLLQQRYWIYSALVFGHDVTVSSYEAAFPALRLARPSVVMGVPGFYETTMKYLSGRAESSGRDVGELAQEFFGGRVRYLWTGSAPARPELLRFFGDAGLPIFEGYGLNETCIVAKNGPGAHRVGSVGRVLPGKSVSFDPDGVISIRSEFPVGAGYAYCPPGESAKMFVAPGVVRTGDLGYLDDDGFLFIRGRADDVIVLDNGRKIVVRPIEEKLKASAAIEDCVLFCPTQTALVAVLSPAGEPADLAAITAHVQRSNAELTADQQIARVVIAQPRFTVENGLLSGQFKPRRQEILDRFRDQIAPAEAGAVR